MKHSELGCRSCPADTRQVSHFAKNGMKRPFMSSSIRNEPSAGNQKENSYVVVAVLGRCGDAEKEGDGNALADGNVDLASRCIGLQSVPIGLFSSHGCFGPRLWRSTV